MDSQVATGTGRPAHPGLVRRPHPRNLEVREVSVGYHIQGRRGRESWGRTACLISVHGVKALGHMMFDRVSFFGLRNSPVWVGCGRINLREADPKAASGKAEPAAEPSEKAS